MVTKSVKPVRRAKEITVKRVYEKGRTVLLIFPLIIHKIIIAQISSIAEGDEEDKSLRISMQVSLEKRQEIIRLTTDHNIAH